MDASPIVLATRGSALALAQARWVRDRFQELLPQRRTSIQVFRTTGDALQGGESGALPEKLPKGLFTREIEDALLDRRADVAVHSLKDLPTELPTGLRLSGVSLREDPARSSWRWLRSRLPSSAPCLPEPSSGREVPGGRPCWRPRGRIWASSPCGAMSPPASPGSLPPPGSKPWCSPGPACGAWDTATVREGSSRAWSAKRPSTPIPSPPGPAPLRGPGSHRTGDARGRRSPDPALRTLQPPSDPTVRRGRTELPARHGRRMPLPGGRPRLAGGKRNAYVGRACRRGGCAPVAGRSSRGPGRAAGRPAGGGTPMKRRGS